MRRKNYKKQGKFDKKFLILTLLLTVLGLIALTDASAPSALNDFGDKYYYLKQQLIWGVTGIALLFIFSNLNYKIWEKLAVQIFFISIILLILVLIPGVGVRVLGARRWIVLGGLTFQPSEVIKFSLCIYFAKLAANDKKLFSYMVPLGLISFLIILQPDLGTTISITTIGLVQMFLAGVNLLHFVGTLFGFGILGFLVILISDYRRDRLLTFLQQTQDPLGKGYHIRQILLALGSGGLFGVGIGQSRQKYLFLPEAATDSIFAVVAEEVGFVGSSLLIVVFLAFILRGLKIMKSAPDEFSKILSAGIVTWIGGQAFLNIASMLALVPLTGIPLPFFSYGGSSLTTILAASGILLNVSKHSK